MDLLLDLDACKLCGAASRKAEHPLAGIPPAMYSVRFCELALNF
jgi:hypothetical protein